MEFPDRFLELFPGEELPEVIGVPCCSQFALSAWAVRARGREEYVRMRKWLLESELDSATSGRIFEYAWHSKFSFYLLFVFLFLSLQWVYGFDDC